MKTLIFIGLLVLIVIIFSQKIEFTSLDLGRHLANGRFVWQDAGLLFKNFYSYSEPEFPFINHHWLTGVIFYGLYLAGGFQLLSLFSILLWLMIFGLAFNLAARRAGFYLSALLAWPAIFLLSQRPDIRPEVFSYLFLLLTWWLLEKAEETKNHFWLLWFLPLFAIWANLHIYFFLGLALIVFQILVVFLSAFFRDWPAWGRIYSQLREFLSDAWSRAWRPTRLWFYYGLVAVLACLLNPNTWRGLFYPLNILRQYGYEIAENKSVFFMEKLSVNPNFFIFKFLLALLFLSWVIYWFFKREVRGKDFLISILFTALGLFATRNLALFALATFIISSRNLAPALLYFQPLFSDWAEEKKERVRLILSTALFIVLIGAGTYLFLDARSYHNFIKQAPGWGLAAGSEESARFFKEHNLSGPIFNNYDLGSALIFWLYPEERVFVDNRPEAYSVSFFTDVYKPLQIDSFAWEKYSQYYDFQTIYFSHTDSTPWARQFINFILDNPDWKLVYFDAYVVILRPQATAVEIKAEDTIGVDEFKEDASGEGDEPSRVEPSAISREEFRFRLRRLAAASAWRDRFNLATLAELAGQPDLSREINREILLLQPNNPQALISLAYLYSAGSNPQDWRQALNYFDRALALGHDLPAVYNQKGLTYFNLGDYEQAAAQWKLALKRDKKNATAGHYLAELARLQVEGQIPNF